MTTVRFTELERYDPRIDEEIIELFAITDVGTFHAEVPARGARSIREARKEFRDRAIESMRAGIRPCELRLYAH
jgi:hypothetical protein